MKLRSLLLIALVAVVFCGCHSYQPTSITVASYNLRNANGSDSAKGNGWGQRYPVIAKMVQYHDFDIFGTQECFIHQLKDMKEALPGYDYIGVGRDDGKEKGEHSAIFYRTDKFDVIEKGDFWLSETPDVPSKGWDAVLPRICSWGHFKCKDTGFEFLFFNLHMDHIGKKARVESAYLVQDKMKELGKGKELPAILTGDFNVDQTHQSYDAFVSKGVLCDSYEKCDFRYATNGTFNDFDPDSFTESRIDRIRLSCFQSKKIWCADRHVSQYQRKRRQEERNGLSGRNRHQSLSSPHALGPFPCKSRTGVRGRRTKITRKALPVLGLPDKTHCWES